jgi:RNA polymerase sigma factor for flagellar operon FliA
MDADMEKLVHEYLGLTQSLAQQVWRTAPHALEADEMRSIAYFGLVDAASRWKGYCARNNHSPDALQFFKPYVVRRVYGALIDAIRSSDWATRSLRTRAKMLQEAGQERGATEKQLVERTGLSVKEVRGTIRGMAQRPVSLEAEDLDPQSTGSVESSIFTQQVLSQVVETVKSLPEEEQAVLALHYFSGLQLQQVASSMGISESRASALHANAVLAVHANMVTAAQQRELDGS